MKFKKLFTPFKINNCEIKNRFVVPAMVTNYCDENGNITDRFIKYHEEKAKGGWGLIITEDYGVNPHGVGYKNCVRLYDEKQVPANQKLTAAVHKYGAKIFAQVFHPGRQTSHQVNGNVQPVAAGRLPDPFNQDLPHQLTVDEIHQLVKEFGHTAKLLKESGFDGIELHMAHGYLLAGFLSTRQNKRTDEYGGCLANRLRIIHEIYHEIRRNVGIDFPLTGRLSLTEDSVDGRKMAETMAIVHDLQDLGFDGLNLSNGEYVDGAPEIISSSFTPKGYNLVNAKRVRENTHIPLCVANGINDPMLAEDVLDENITDFVGMARASLADPYLPKKVAEGRLDDINQCIRCLQGCEGGLMSGHAVTCMVNPRVGKEYKYDFKPVASKKVLIIGGGPAGLEAAITAARRGHDVTLWEAKDEFGGEFVPAAYPPAKGEYAQMVHFLVRQLKIRGVHYELNHKATVDEIKDFGADKVIIATGAEPNLIKFPGLDSNHYAFARDVLLGKTAVNGHIVIIGGGEVGTETAMTCADLLRGDVTIVEPTPHIGAGIGRMTPTLRFFRDHQVKVMTKTNVEKITADSVVVEHDGQETSLPADNIILSTGYHSVNDLLDAFKDDPKVVGIGDATNCSNAVNATKTGFEAGYNA